MIEINLTEAEQRLLPFYYRGRQRAEQDRTAIEPQVWAILFAEYGPLCERAVGVKNMAELGKRLNRIHLWAIQKGYTGCARIGGR